MTSSPDSSATFARRVPIRPHPMIPALMLGCRQRSAVARDSWPHDCPCRSPCSMARADGLAQSTWVPGQHARWSSLGSRAACDRNMSSELNLPQSRSVLVGIRTRRPAWPPSRAVRHGIPSPGFTWHGEPLNRPRPTGRVPRR
jgi:hypothetical protein